MAKGREAHEARLALLQSFGKDLARRAKSKCELCEEAGLTLSIVEIPPVPNEPEFERCVLLCERCARAIEDLKPLPPGDSWRVLAKTVWSEVPAVQALALRLLKRQAETEAWARETLETVFVDAEVEALAAEEA